MEFIYLPFFLIILFGESIFLLHVEETSLNHRNVLTVQLLLGILFLLFCFGFVITNNILSGCLLLGISMLSFMSAFKIYKKV